MLGGGMPEGLSPICITTLVFSTRPIMKTITTATYKLNPGTLPLLISMPHVGTELPPEFVKQMSPSAAMKQDTDWHLDLLYGFACSMGASVLQARVSRYVIDLNRPPGGESLYPGQITTGLCPLETFHGEPLYLPGSEPDSTERERRLRTYWKPYHNALQQELVRIKTARVCAAVGCTLNYQRIAASV